MRSEVRTAIAAVVTLIVVLTSATMALADDGGSGEPNSSQTPGPTATTPTAPEPSVPEPTVPEPSVPAPSATAPEPTVSPVLPETTRTIDDAQLRWGVNNESNNRAFAPGTFNFLSAGKIGNPGSGGKLISSSDDGATWDNGRAAGWSAKVGNVAIEKFLNKAWKQSSFADVKTNSNGQTLTGTNGFSNHEVVFSNGNGTVDRTKGTASIQWTGSFTVIYYSGYSFFYVSDPKLTVVGKVGTLTATLSGYGSSIDNMDRWDEVEPVPDVVIATIPNVSLASDKGFSLSPSYSKVAVSVPEGQAEQTRSGPHWGSFPQSFINYQSAAGTGSFWYSSGGGADPHKVALPVTVSYSAAAPVKAAPPKAPDTTTPPIVNDAPEAPQTPVASNSAPSAPVVPMAPPAVTAPTTPSDALQSSAVTAQFRPVSAVTGVPAAQSDSSDRGLWLLGTALLVTTLLVAASPFIYAATARRRGTHTTT